MEIQIFKTSKPIFGQIEELKFVLYVNYLYVIPSVPRIAIE